MILIKELKELLKEMWTNLSDGEMRFYHSAQEEKQLHNTGLTKSLTVQVKGGNFRFQTRDDIETLLLTLEISISQFTIVRELLSDMFQQHYWHLYS